MATLQHSAQRKLVARFPADLRQTSLPEAKLDRLLSEAIAEIHRGDVTFAVLERKSSGLDKTDVEALVRRVMKKELDSELTKTLLKQLKTDDCEKLIAVLVGKVLARFFEIMFTRKGSWQSQLKT